MKKTLSIVCALVACSLTAQADYTWNGGSSITQALWQNQNSWTLSEESTWPTGGNGPGTPNSDAWDKINISNASGTVSTLEGWTLELALENTNLTVGTLKKLQGGSSVTIDANSTLTVSWFAGGNDGGDQIFDNNGTFNLALAKNTGGNGFTLNLGETGIANITSARDSHTFKLRALTATLPTGVASLTGTSFTTVTRQLVTLGSGVTFSSDSTLIPTINANGFTEVASAAELSAGKYFISNTSDGISITYAVAVPEPATATLSLLALAGLAARRRRK